MYQRLPFYMAYPQEVLWDEESMCNRDYEYMKSTYPDMAKRIMPYVEKECDRLEYMGSMMFDEYPDQLQLRLMCRRIYESVRDDMKENEKSREFDEWIKDMIWIIAWQEILKRRSEYRKYRRKFY